MKSIHCGGVDDAAGAARRSSQSKISGPESDAALLTLGDEDRSKGLSVVVEYAGERGEPQWSAPPQAEWDYSAFGAAADRAEPDERIELTVR